MPEQVHDIDDPGSCPPRISRMFDWRAVAAATWFESLIVAPHPLQRCPRRNDLLFDHEEHEVHGAWRSADSADSADFRRFPQIQIYESGKKEIRKWEGGLKLVRRPLSLAATRSFAFYLGNPFPRFCGPD
jgi:hypothetical protein